MALTPGTRLGVYEIASLLGEGGFARVYKARDRRLDRVVAIKVIRPEAVGDASIPRCSTMLRPIFRPTW